MTGKARKGDSDRGREWAMCCYSEPPFKISGNQKVQKEKEGRRGSGKARELEG